VTVVTGAVFTGLWASKGSSAKNLNAMVPHNMPCPPGGTGATGNCATIVSDLNTKATFGTVAVATFGTAGAMSVATLIYGLAAGPRAARSGLVIAPTVSAQGGGIVAGGSF
jgi:hypothetical protein